MRCGLVAAALLVVGVAPALAQGLAGGQAPPPPVNLQILAKDTPRPQVIQIMQGFTAALGVDCSYCHVEGAGGRNDFASDGKPVKHTAREMMTLTREINEKLPALVGKASGAAATVACATCHRGVAIPKQLTELVTEAAASSGAEAGLAKYKELRDKYYGGQSFDFSENSLITLGQRAQAAGRSDDALTYLRANLQYFPKSSRTYQVIAQVENAKGDKDGAIKDLEKSIELNPDNQQARGLLKQLKGQ